MTTTTTEAQIRELGERWADAEQRGDVALLDELSVDEFAMVGPAGFILDKPQWLHRYRAGDLVTHSLEWDELAVRDFGGTALVIGRHTQRAAYRGNPADGSFRATHIAVRRDGRWRLAGIHMSPIAGPPPSTAAQTREDLS
ncbi:nuclear transport factor 2 family protein [Actinopolymorpha singaporensis]|uniref:Ketosteroid isomerase homolog n=1 Tax=Actinopolymorpha singaporensis TaxID=117157 RepID=A0A1H1RHN3_9ACTN|nr:nuclear transport factor 2 family protein [Actinopolymorpha singaporensis]SDS35066.1 Ketosteroid isomerase homolog [Actinopolymorpha singaporensis]